MRHSPHQEKRPPGGSKRRGGPDDVVGMVLRAVALAALALGIGVGASLLVDTRQAGYLGTPAAKR